MNQQQQTFFDLVKEARSCRRYDEAAGLAEGTMEWLVDCARLIPCARNQQALRYVAVTSPKARNAMITSLSWAAALKDWKGPKEGERPGGFLVICTPPSITPHMRMDLGIAGQTIQLAATYAGLASCMFVSFDPAKVKPIIDVEEPWETALVLAIGKPAETRCVAPVPPSGELTYWRDEKSVHHVPKYDLDQVFFGHK